MSISFVPTKVRPQIPGTTWTPRHLHDVLKLVMARFLSTDPSFSLPLSYLPDVANLFLTDDQQLGGCVYHDTVSDSVAESSAQFQKVWKDPKDPIAFPEATLPSSSAVLALFRMTMMGASSVGVMTPGTAYADINEKLVSGRRRFRIRGATQGAEVLIKYFQQLTSDVTQSWSGEGEAKKSFPLKRMELSPPEEVQEEDFKTVLDEFDSKAVPSKVSNTRSLLGHATALTILGSIAPIINTTNLWDVETLELRDREALKVRGLADRARIHLLSMVAQTFSIAKGLLCLRLLKLFCGNESVSTFVTRYTSDVTLLEWQQKWDLVDKLPIPPLFDAVASFYNPYSCETTPWGKGTVQPIPNAWVSSLLNPENVNGKTTKKESITHFKEIESLSLYSNRKRTLNLSDLRPNKNTPLSHCSTLLDAFWDLFRPGIGPNSEAHPFLNMYSRVATACGWKPFTSSNPASVNLRGEVVAFDPIRVSHSVPTTFALAYTRMVPTIATLGVRSTLELVRKTDKDVLVDATKKTTLLNEVMAHRFPILWTRNGVAVASYDFMQVADPRDFGIMEPETNLTSASAHIGTDLWFDENTEATLEKIFGEEWPVIAEWIQSSPLVWRHLGALDIESRRWVPVKPAGGGKSYLCTTPAIREAHRNVEVVMPSYSYPWLLQTTGEYIAGTYDLADDLFVITPEIVVPEASLLSASDGDLVVIGVESSGWSVVETAKLFH